MLYSFKIMLSSKEIMMVQKDDIFDSFSKAATGAISSVSGAKEDINNFMKGRLEALLNDLEIVQREEFDALKAMVLSQAAEIKELKEKLNEK